MQLRKKLGELLIESGLIDEGQLATALAHQRNWGGRLGENLVKLGFLTERQLLDFLSRHFKLPKVDFTRFRVQPQIIKLLSPEKAKRLRVVPLGIKTEKGKKVLFVAVSDPTNVSAIDEIAFITGMRVQPVVATDTALEAAIKYYYEGHPVPPWEALKEQTVSKTEGEEPELVIATDEEFLKADARAEHEKEEKKHSAPLRSIWEYTSDELVRALLLVLIKKGYITVTEIEEELQ